MSDLISRSELLKMFPVNLNAPFWHVTGIRAAIGAVDVVDAVPVVHARWKMTDSPYCSACRKIAIFKYRYCPACGAKMDGDSDG